MQSFQFQSVEKSQYRAIFERNIVNEETIMYHPNTNYLIVENRQKTVYIYKMCWIGVIGIRRMRILVLKMGSISFNI